MGKDPCPEFPFFGANYPDATCIDGYLWDLDSGNPGEPLEVGGDIPCPFCNGEEAIEEIMFQEEDVTEEAARERVNKFRAMHGFGPVEDVEGKT